HLASQESGARLRLRINELLGKSSKEPESLSKMADSEIAQAAAALEAEFQPEFIEPDPTHLFYDQLQHISLMMRELSPDDLSSEALEEILDLSDQLINALSKARKRPRKANLFGI
ncbi:MAG: hypothetical protein HOP19_29605, partial [Acidobacteria bacterium]|nr:hypothetical protein [Acidobacteriota bacterium]